MVLPNDFYSQAAQGPIFLKVGDDSWWSPQLSFSKSGAHRITGVFIPRDFPTPAVILLPVPKGLVTLGFG